MTPSLRTHYRDQLGVDGDAIRDFGDRLQALIIDLHHEAAQASDRATAQAMLDLASEVRTAVHTPFSAMLAAHEAAADELGIEAPYSPDADVALALGLPIKSEPAREELQRAVDLISKAFAPKVPAE